MVGPSHRPHDPRAVGVTLRALKLSQGGQIPVAATAWYHKEEPTFSDCLALVPQHLWRAQ
jgi:hypothetical protein